MTRTHRVTDTRISRTYTKLVYLQWEWQTLSAVHLVGAVHSKDASGTDQLGGVKAAPRQKSLKRGRKGKRILDPHPYSCDILRYSQSPFEIVSPSYAFVTTDMLPYVGDRGHLPIDSDWHNRVMAKLRSKIYGSSWNPATTMGEAGKAIDMIGSAALRIRRGLLCAALGDWRGIVKNFGTPTGAHASKYDRPGKFYGGPRARRRKNRSWQERLQQSCIGVNEGRKTLASLWLEIQYGWKPLLYDIEIASAFIAEAVNGASKNGASMKATMKFSGEGYVAPSSNQAWMAHKKTSTTVTYQVINLRSNPVWLPTIESVAATAWELLPYSFVYDWVIPVGSYLEALRASADIKGTIVCTTFQETTWDSPTAGLPATVRPLDPSISARYQLISHRRTVGSELAPRPPIGDLSPSSIFSSWKKAVSAVALLQNLRFKEGDRLGIRKLLDGTP